MIRECLTGITTAAGTTLTALTMQGGDSLTIRSLGQAYLKDAWTDSQTTGRLRITSPSLHDAQQGLRFNHVASEVYPLFTQGIAYPLITQDTLTVQQTGSATAGDIDTSVIDIVYPYAPGGNYLTYSQFLKDWTGHVMTVENSITLATSGAYTSRALNADFDYLKANYYYCVMGITTTVEVANIFIQGPATGNYRVGIPGHENNKEVNRERFIKDAMFFEKYNWPMIPKLNAADKVGTVVGTASDENAGTAVLTVYLALMKK